MIAVITKKRVNIGFCPSTFQRWIATELTKIGVRQRFSRPGYVLTPRIINTINSRCSRCAADDVNRRLRVKMPESTWRCLTRFPQGKSVIRPWKWHVELSLYGRSRKPHFNKKNNLLHLIARSFEHTFCSKIVQIKILWSYDIRLINTLCVTTHLHLWTTAKLYCMLKCIQVLRIMWLETGLISRMFYNNLKNFKW